MLRSVTSVFSCGSMAMQCRIHWNGGAVYAGYRFTRLIEKHAESLARDLVLVLHASDRTDAYRSIPREELEHDIRELYQHLGDWLNTKTESDIQKRYSRLGARRAAQKVPIEQFTWAMVLAKEQVWYFLQSEAVNDSAMQLLNELEFVFSLEQFFDRALYHSTMGYRMSSRKEAA